MNLQALARFLPQLDLQLIKEWKESLRGVFVYLEKVNGSELDRVQLYHTLGSASLSMAKSLKSYLRDVVAPELLNDIKAHYGGYLPGNQDAGHSWLVASDLQPSGEKMGWQSG